MGGGLKAAGAAGMVAGLIGVLIAVQMNTSVHTDSTYRYGTFLPSSDTINIGLLQNQHLTFLGAGILFLAGVIALCAGFVVEAIGGGRHSSSPLAAATPTAASPEAYQLRARQGEMTDEQRVSAAKADRLILVVGGVIGLIALIAIFVFGVGHGGGGTADQAMIANNAEALADAMEMQADNMDALPDTTGGTAR